MELVRAVHLVPYDGVGGVETASRAMADRIYGNVEFSKLYLVRKSDVPSKASYSSENDPRYYWRALRELLAAKPALVIASLWRCYAVLIIFKILRPGTRVVTFLHYPANVHWLDCVCSGLAMLLSQIKFSS